jgi:hypothetical protein
LPEPPAPEPFPAVAAPAVAALAVDAMRAAVTGGGYGTTILGGSATTGVGSANLAAAPSLSMARSTVGGGGVGTGGGGSAMSKVFNRSTVWATVRTVRPDRISAAKPTCTMTTPPSAFIRSGLSAAR